MFTLWGKGEVREKLVHFMFPFINSSYSPADESIGVTGFIPESLKITI